jgi:hypothetical protein
MERGLVAQRPRQHRIAAARPNLEGGECGAHRLAFPFTGARPSPGQSAPAGGGSEQAQGAGVLDGLGPVVRAELGVQVADVGPDGVR